MTSSVMALVHHLAFQKVMMAAIKFVCIDMTRCTGSVPWDLKYHTSSNNF